MNAIKVAEDIYWVGAIDWNVRNFHGYITERGTTYNAFLIMDEKVTLIDTVKAPFSSELLSRIETLIDPKKIDILIANHVEVDHSGGIPAVLESAPGAEFYCSHTAAQDFRAYYDTSGWNVKAVGSGDTLKVGKRELAFLEVPMVHWPDQMVTYDATDKILFSSDAFGQHIATVERFADEVGWEHISLQAKKYYANIVLPFAGPVKRALEAASKLDIGMILCAHGVCWRRPEDIQRIVGHYVSWANNETVEKVVVVYDTMWKSTEMLAKTILEGAVSEGVQAKLFNLTETHRSDVMADVIDARAILVGSPTLNMGLFPTVSDFLTYMTGLRPRGRIGGAFGSFGWSGEAMPQIEGILEKAKFEVIKSGINPKYRPKREDIQQAFEYGKEIAQKCKAAT
jgi:flavorubredoxin